MHSAATLLQDVFGFSDFRSGQEEIVHTVAAGTPTLAIMPTGGGKSLCFQLPALMRDGVTVVISPLIALMRDQVRALKAVGVEAGALTSGNTEEETAEVWEALDAGRMKLLYIAPERLAAGAAIGMLRRSGVSMIAVDEAQAMTEASRFLWKIQAAAGLLTGGDFDPAILGEGARRMILRESRCDDLDALHAQLMNARQLADDIITRKLGEGT